MRRDRKSGEGEGSACLWWVHCGGYEASAMADKYCVWNVDLEPHAAILRVRVGVVRGVRIRGREVSSTPRSCSVRDKSHRCSLIAVASSRRANEGLMSVMNRTAGESRVREVHGAHIGEQGPESEPVDKRRVH